MEDAAMSCMHTLLGVVRQGNEVERLSAVNELISSLVAATSTSPPATGSKVAAGAQLVRPTWARSMADVLSTLPYDNTQMVMYVAINILCGGRMTPSRNYMGVSIVTSPCGKVSGSVSFNNGVQTEKIALAKAA